MTAWPEARCKVSDRAVTSLQVQRDSRAPGKCCRKPFVPWPKRCRGPCSSRGVTECTCNGITIRLRSISRPSSAAKLLRLIDLLPDGLCDLGVKQDGDVGPRTSPSSRRYGHRGVIGPGRTTSRQALASTTDTSTLGSDPAQVPPLLIGRDPRESIPHYHCGDGPRACGGFDQPGPAQSPCRPAATHFPRISRNSASSER